MPAWDRAWRALCRWMAHDDATLAAGPGTDRAGSDYWRGILEILWAGARRWYRLCARRREWMQEAQRTRERVVHEAIRNKRRAKRRALSLLLNLLNPEQRREFQAYGHFHVMGGASGDCYRIRVDSVANIDVLRHDGTVKHRLCAHPTGDIPVYDVMAGQLLYLQDSSTEKRFLAQANSHPALPEAQVRRAQMWIAAGGAGRCAAIEPPTRS
jgi:hypothetical protein